MRPTRLLLVTLTLALLTACSPGPATTAATSSAAAPPAAPAASATPTTAENDLPGAPADWWLTGDRVAGERELGGYTDRVSALAGEPVGLYVTSALGPVTVKAYRVGDYGGAGARLVWTSAELPATQQPEPVVEADRHATTRWQKTTDLPTAGWPDGAYLLTLTAAGKSKYVPFVVRTPSASGRVVLVSAVATHQAYNLWGGWSLYNGIGNVRAGRVSFDRPQTGNGAPWFIADELPVIQLAESLGLPLAYTTSVDVDRDPDALRGATGVVSQGHDEYWTVALRERVEAARDAGTDVAFLGANAVYWRVRLEDGTLGDRRTLVGHKDWRLDPVKDAPETTDKWRSYPKPDPENSLVGMLYECFPAYGPLVVQRPDFFLFEGTGVTQGQAIPGVVGTEIDRAYPVEGTPASLEVVAHSPVLCGGSKKQTYADATYYTTDAGSFVFATGSMMWVKVLTGPNPKDDINDQSVAFVKQVTSNLLREMARPVGDAPPASRPNVADLALSGATSTGTGGPIGGR